MKPVIRSWTLLLIGTILLVGGMFWVRANPRSPESDDPLIKARDSLAQGFGIELATESRPEGGVRVEGVKPGSAAEEAGINAGDRIVACGDRSVWHAYQLAEYIVQELTYTPAVSLLVERDGDYRQVVFGSRPGGSSGRPGPR